MLPSLGLGRLAAVPTLGTVASSHAEYSTSRNVSLRTGLSCLVDQRSTGQTASEVVRGYPSGTQRVSTEAGLVTWNMVQRGTTTLVPAAIINPCVLVKANWLVTLPAKRLALAHEAIFEIVEHCGFYVSRVGQMVIIHC